jgi:hypothetical protein
MMIFDLASESLSLLAAFAIISGQRALRKASAGKNHQAEPVRLTVVDEFANNLLSNVKAVSRLKVDSFHAAGNIQSQHDIDTLDGLSRIAVARLGPAQRQNQYRKTYGFQGGRGRYKIGATGRSYAVHHMKIRVWYRRRFEIPGKITKVYVNCWNYQKQEP